MRLAQVVETWRAVGAHGARNEKSARLAELLRRASPGEVPVLVAWLSGEPVQGRIGIGPAALSGVDAAPAREATLDVAEVDEAFARIASARGSGSAEARRRLLHGILSRATGEEQRFLVRLLAGALRQGALEGILADAVARAAGVPAAAVRRALMLHGSLGEVARAALAQGEAGLARFSLELFRPLKPMLAQSAEDVPDAFGRLGEARFETKLDGARVQVHRAAGDVRVFTRRLNDVTEAVPEIVEAVRALPVREVVLDGEALAFAPDGRPLPFQVTMRRFGRRLDVARMRERLPLTPLFFDCLHLDGETLLDRPLRARLQALEGVVPGRLRVPGENADDPSEAAAVLEAALRAGHEGAMAKALGAPYEAGRRGGSWLKVKPVHTLDLVVLAAEWGHGRRRGWLSNLHLGARDPARGGFVMLGKTFKGLTDEVLAWQTQRLLSLELGRDATTVYVRPELVVEIAFEGVQASPHYPGGVALRFARVVRYRPDKAASDADTIEAVWALRDEGVREALL